MKNEGFGGFIRPAAAALLLPLAACGTTSTPEPRVIVQPVDRPVPVACVPDNLGDEPAYADSDEALKNATPEGRYQLVIAGREQRKSRLGEVEPVIQKCRQTSEGSRL